MDSPWASFFWSSIAREESSEWVRLDRGALEVLRFLLLKKLNVTYPEGGQLRV